MVLSSWDHAETSTEETRGLIYKTLRRFHPKSAQKILLDFA